MRPVPRPAPHSNSLFRSSRRCYLIRWRLSPAVVHHECHSAVLPPLVSRSAGPGSDAALLRFPIAYGPDLLLRQPPLSRQKRLYRLSPSQAKALLYSTLPAGSVKPSTVIRQSG